MVFKFIKIVIISNLLAVLIIISSNLFIDILINKSIKEINAQNIEKPDKIFSEKFISYVNENKNLNNEGNNKHLSNKKNEYLISLSNVNISEKDIRILKYRDININNENINNEITKKQAIEITLKYRGIYLDLNDSKNIKKICNDNISSNNNYLNFILQNNAITPTEEDKICNLDEKIKLKDYSNLIEKIYNIKITVNDDKDKILKYSDLIYILINIK